MASILERNKKAKPKPKTFEEHAENALYREVWEEVNNEKTVRFIKKYSRQIIIGVLVLLIAATGFQIGLRVHNENKIARAVAYETAIGNMDAGALASYGRAGRGAAADLALFQAYMLNGDTDSLERLAQKGRTRDMRDLARMHVVGIRGDKMSADELEKYLSVMNTKKSPYYYASRLMLARRYIADDNRDAANKILDKIISDADAPDIISATAQTLR